MPAIMQLVARGCRSAPRRPARPAPSIASWRSFEVASKSAISLGPRRAVGDRLAQHHHLGERADGDRRHRIDGSARAADRRTPRPGLRRWCGSSATSATGARPIIRRSCAGSTPEPQAKTSTVSIARPVHVRLRRRSASRTCRWCRSSRRRSGPRPRSRAIQSSMSAMSRGVDRRRSGRRRPCRATCPAGPTSRSVRQLFGIALVGGVREQQRHHVVTATRISVMPASSARMAEQLDAVLALLEALVHRLELRLAELRRRGCRSGPPTRPAS